MSIAQIQEVINRNQLVSLLLSHGYNVYLPVYDSGIDLIAHNEATNQTLNIQLKARWTIMQKYVGRNIYIAFPDDEEWYLAPHEAMVAMGHQHNFTKTKSWLDQKCGHHYNCPKLSQKIKETMKPYLLERLAR